MTADAWVLILLILAIPIVAGVIVGRAVFKRITGAAPPAGSRLDRKWVVRLSAAILSLYGGAFFYAWLIEPQWVEATRTEVRVRQPVLGQSRFRIVHLTDLHAYDWGRREERVRDIVREARPDVILITGDFVRRNPGFATLEELVRSFDAPYGIYGVCGNNDLLPLSVSEIQPMGVKFLQDTKVLLSKGDRRLCLAGRFEDATCSLRSILHDVPADALTIFLSHKPDDVDELSRLGPGQRVDLFLCGHTHGGQVCLPFWGAVVTESKYHKRYERGLYDVNGTPMYVNRGIGTTLLPLRFLARPEVAIIDLVFRD